MTGIRVDLTPVQQRKLGVEHIVIPEEEASNVMGRLLSARGGGRPKSPDRCRCGKMTLARAAKRGHKC